jgi:hypothetical protein
VEVDTLEAPEESAAIPAAVHPFVINA